MCGFAEKPQSCVRRSHHFIFARSMCASRWLNFCFSEVNSEQTFADMRISIFDACSAELSSYDAGWRCRRRLDGMTVEYESLTLVCTTHSTHNIEFIIYMEIRACCGVSDSAFSTFFFFCQRLRLCLTVYSKLRIIMTKRAIRRSKNQT